MSTSTSTATIPSREFYSEYHGHPVRYLERALPALRASSDRIIWTAGDSSLDNKYWFPDTAPAVGAYERLLNPPLMKQDVTYWLNYHCQQSDARNRTAAVNTAVEATTLNERTFALRRQDIFLRDNIKPQDILIVSVGGNDLALAPCPCTIVSAATFMFCMPEACWRNGFTCGTVPFDDCCCGCGASLASCACGCPPCMGYFRHLYGTRLELYIKGRFGGRGGRKVFAYPHSTTYWFFSLFLLLKMPFFLFHSLFVAVLPPSPSSPHQENKAISNLGLYDLLPR